MEKHEQSIVAFPPKNGTRRRFSTPFKRAGRAHITRRSINRLGRACQWPQYQLLARWRHDYPTTQAAGQSPALIPIRVTESQPAPSSAPAQLATAIENGEIVTRRGDVAVNIRSTLSHAALGMVLRTPLQSSIGGRK